MKTPTANKYISNFKKKFDIRNFSPEERSHFITNLVVGFVIAIVFHSVAQTTWGIKNINWQYDYYVVSEAKEAVQNYNDSKSVANISDRIRFIDIDHDQYKKWGRPSITPRDELANIIDLSVKNGAKAIIVDIAFDQPDWHYPDKDRTLRIELEKIRNMHSPPFIILASTVSYDGYLMPNVFDDQIDERRIFRAAASVRTSPGDGVARFWVPYEIITDSSGKTKVLWNASLLSAVLVDGNIDELKKIESKLLSPESAKQNHQDVGTFILQNEQQTYAEIRVSNHSSDMGNRFRFLIIPPRANAKVAEDVGSIPFYAVQTPEKLSSVFVDSPHMSFKDRFVLIGNSSPDSGDIHTTPVGRMPGMYVQGNVLNTILSNLQVRDAGFPWMVLIEIFSIIFTAYAFLHLTPFLAKTTASIVIVSLGGLVYWHFMKQGIFLNFVFPLVGIGLHSLFVSVEKNLLPLVMRAKGGNIK